MPVDDFDEGYYDIPSVSKCEYCGYQWCDSNEPSDCCSTDTTKGDTYWFCSKLHLAEFILDNGDRLIQMEELA